LENGDFSRNVNAAPSGWTASSANTGADIVIQSSYSIGKPAGLPPNVLRLNGAANKMTRVHQDLPYSGGHGDSYVIGGWARTLTRPSRGELDLCNIVVYYKTSSSSTYVEAGNVSWSEEWSDWQYACASVVIPQNYTGLRFAVLYQYNVNYTEFAGLHMFKEDFGKSYVYDNAGNVVSATNLAGYNSDATYDSYNNMLSYRAPGSTYLTTLNYGSTDAEKKQHLLRSGQTPQGVKQSYTYDDKGNITSTQQSGTGSSAFLKTTTAYTTNKNYPATITNTRGKTITNEYDQTLGTLTSLTDPDGQVLNYQYDLLNRTINTVTTASSKTYRNDYVYSNDKLSQVKHNTTSNMSSDVVLNFEYDALGNRTRTKIGSQTAALSTMVYSGSGDQLPIRTEFGNGGKIHYDRDEFKRIKEIRVDDDDFPICEYDYDANGNVGRFHDGNLGAAGITTTYEYDLSNRLARARSMDYNYHEYTTEYAYNERNLVSKFKEIVGENRLTYETNYQYDIDNRPTNIAFGSTNPSLTYDYDAIGRTTSRKLADGTNNYTSTYAYLAGGQGTNSTTKKISSITQSGMNFSYAYDNRGNVSSETRGNTATSYLYEEIGQLTRVNSAADSKTWTFEYDRGGNLLNKKRYAYTTGSLGTVQETISYTYGDSNWKDKLTNYNGMAITYDAIGNPLYDGTWTYTWQAGRQLTYMANANHNLYFQYSAKGQRTSKLYDDSTATVYTWNGDTLTHLVKDANTLHFWHDAAGLPTMVRFNGADYFYIYNRQGDVVGLVQKGTTNVVVEYTYDAWGKILSTSGTLAATLGAANPFKYRAYIYDDETGLYYLKDRYYNPVWGRFLNADLELGAIGQPLSHNLYAYCNNNPVSYADPTGTSAVAGAGTVALVNPFTAVVIFAAIIIKAVVDKLTNKATSTSKPAAKQVQKSTPTVKTSLKAAPVIPPPPVEKIVYDPAVGGQTPADLQIIVQQAALKAIADERNPQGSAVHHIVAQADPRAANSRIILEDNSIGINDDDNLISITQKLHQYLHTALYYKTVENLLKDAADKAHNPYAEEIFVRLTLNGIGTVLEGVDYAFFR
jgi:RHS repeat-associated protein